MSYKSRVMLLALAAGFAWQVPAVAQNAGEGWVTAWATSQQGLGPAQILEAIPLLIPSTLPYTIPATTLFATCVVYGRLAHDNEILAIKAAGVNVMKAVWPAVVLGGLMSAASMGLYYRLIPYTHFLLRSQFLNEVEEYLYSLLKKDHAIKQPGLNYAIFVRSVHGRSSTTQSAQ